MSDGLPNPKEVEDARRALRMIAGMVAEHYEAMREVGFTDDQAFVLARDRHRVLACGTGEDEE